MCELRKLNPLGEKKNDGWETPDPIFCKLYDEFHFTLDVCATKENTKCTLYFTKEDDGLSRPWNNNLCWMNPPYSCIGLWVEKAYQESLKEATVVCLLPNNTDNRWFHNICSKGEIRLLKGRIAFLKNGIPTTGNPKGSIVVIFGKNYPPRVRFWGNIILHRGRIIRLDD